MMLYLYNIETKRLSDIVNEGASHIMDDLQFLERELRKWLKSEDRKRMIEADYYYDFEQAVKNKKRMVIGEGGVYTEDRNLPNNKYMDNQYATMVDQKVNYLLAKAITFDTDNDQYADELKAIFNKRFMRQLKNLGKDAYNGGIGWLYPYYDEQGNFKIRSFKPYEILPFWKDDTHTELDFAVRYYERLGYENHVEKVFKFVEIYDTRGIHKFTFDNGLKPDYSTYYFELPDLDGELIPYNWNRVPIIPFKANAGETSLLKKCKALQDGVNELLSIFGDSMVENAGGNSILILKNYRGENLGEFRRNLSTLRAVSVVSNDGCEGGLETLQIEVNATNYALILSELRKAIVVNCRGYDINELKSSGSPNEMTIKSVYSQIDLDANELETEFQASFEELLFFVNTHLQQTSRGDFFNEKVDVIFNRDMMVNESQVIQNVNASLAVLSRKSCIAMHPWINDVEGELDQIKKEEQEAFEAMQLGNSFEVKPENEE